MEFDWDRAYAAHIGRHNVRPEEAEQVLRNDPVAVRYEEPDGEERVLVLGRTDAGRLLAVVHTEEATVSVWLQRTG
jgi:uncharacterized DUF497 family protein